MAKQPKKAPDAESTLTISVTLRGDTRRALVAMQPDALKSTVAKALAIAIDDGAPELEVEAPTPEGAVSPERTIKRAFLTKAEGDTEERYVLGVVMEPDEVDTQGDTQSAEDIRKAAFAFMEDYRNGGGHMGLMHKQIVDGKLCILESYIQKADETIGDQPVKTGTWMMAMRVIDDGLWDAVKSGDYTGFSIGGTAVKQPV